MGACRSRLFQEIRENRGLAYSIYSFASGHADTGVFGLYAGCTPGKVDEVVALMVAESSAWLPRRSRRPSCERSMGQLAGGLVLGMEDSGSRMSRLGKSELVHGSLLSIDESLDLIRAVTAQDVQELAGELACPPTLDRACGSLRRLTEPRTGEAPAGAEDEHAKRFGSSVV